jgi:putative transposase
MPRPLRYPLIDVPQHVIQRGHNRQPVFFHPDDYQKSRQTPPSAECSEDFQLHGVFVNMRLTRMTRAKEGTR